MPRPDYHAELAADAATTAALLDNGKALAMSSAVLFLSIPAFWLSGLPLEPFTASASVFMALLQTYLALRVRFDASIFWFWSLRWSDSTNPVDDMTAFDKRIGRNPPDETIDAKDNLAQRKQGALRLFRYQVLSVTLQLILTGAAIWH